MLSVWRYAGKSCVHRVVQARSRSVFGHFTNLVAKWPRDFRARSHAGSLCRSKVFGDEITNVVVKFFG